MTVYQRGPASATAKADGSPVTEADLAADRIIRAGLAQAWPAVPVWSEESAGAPPAGTEAFFLVDPLDGTREFLSRNGEFTVNIALVVQGRPVAGAVLLPAQGELFTGAPGLGAWQGTREGGRAPISVARRPDGAPLRLLGSRSHVTAAQQAWLARVAQAYELHPMGSSAKFCRIAQGRADAYARMGPTCQWDTAAGQAVLEAAGGRVLDPAGQPLAYGTGRPVLNPDFIALGDLECSLPPLA